MYLQVVSAWMYPMHAAKCLGLTNDFVCLRTCVCYINYYVNYATIDTIHGGSKMEATLFANFLTKPKSSWFYVYFIKIDFSVLKIWAVKVVLRSGPPYVIYIVAIWLCLLMTCSVLSFYHSVYVCTMCWLIVAVDFIFI